MTISSDQVAEMTAVWCQQAYGKVAADLNRRLAELGPRRPVPPGMFNLGEIQRDVIEPAASVLNTLVTHVPGKPIGPIRLQVIWKAYESICSDILNGPNGQSVLKCNITKPRGRKKAARILAANGMIPINPIEMADMVYKEEDPGSSS